MAKRRAWITFFYLLAALAMVCIGQYYRLYMPLFPWDAAIFFVAGCALFARLLIKSEVAVPQSVEAAPPPAEARPRWWLLAFAIVFALLAWQQSAKNTFTLPGVLAWWAAVFNLIAAFWTWTPIRWKWPLSREGLSLRLDWHALAVIGLILLAVFTRFYRLDAIPPEMNSDHVEKLYDVYDVLMGAHPIYFERNTGREPMQFYMAVAIIRLFDTGVTHYTLKLTNALMGVLSVIGVYLLGCEIGGKRLALLAGFFAAVSIWPVATSRVGLRYPFAPAFTSLALWSLLRALRTRRRNDWLIAGLMLGLGLHGYTAFRLMPVAAVALIGLDGSAHWKELKLEWRKWLMNVVVYVAVTAIIFLPLGHYMIEKPQMFWFRTLTRAGDVERPVTGEPLFVFAQTFSKTIGMFNWLGDEVWVCTIPLAPALDVLGGSLLLMGFVYTVVYLRRKRSLLAAQLVYAGVILLLPSALNLAFPGESPSVVRAGGAMPVVAVMFALALGHLYDEIRATLDGKPGQVIANVGLTVFLISMAAINYQRYTVSYVRQYYISAMNTREVAAAVRDYVNSVGSFDQVYLKGWPHWLDARALSLQVAEQPGWENSHVTMEPQDLPKFPADPTHPRLYLVSPLDKDAIAILRATFPNGTLTLHRSDKSGHDFIFFFVPGRGG